MKKLGIFFAGLLALIFPVALLAQGVPNTGYIDTWFNSAGRWLSQAVVLIMVVLTIVFLISIIRLVFEKDAAKLKDRRKAMFNSLIGLFIAVSVWGIIKLAGSILGTNNPGNPSGVCPPGMTYSGGRCI